MGNIKVELRLATSAGHILEAALKLRDPERWQARQKNEAEAEANGKVTLGNDWWGYSPFRRLPASGLTGVNRELSKARIEHFMEEMMEGRWHFSPDPIVISEEGFILNGQHRLAAAAVVTYNGSPAGLASQYRTSADKTWPGAIPQLLVVWGVDKRTALLMDEAARSTSDRRHIALAYAEVVNAA